MHRRYFELVIAAMGSSFESRFSPVQRKRNKDRHKKRASGERRKGKRKVR